MNHQEKIIERIYSESERVGGRETMTNYIFKTLDWLSRCIPGKIYTVSDLVLPENIELFTEIVKLYIYMDKENKLTFIRDDYKQFRKQS